MVDDVYAFAQAMLYSIKSAYISISTRTVFCSCSCASASACVVGVFTTVMLVVVLMS